MELKKIPERRSPIHVDWKNHCCENCCFKVYRFNIISTKIPPFFIEIEKYLKIILKHQRTWDPKSTLSSTHNAKAAFLAAFQHIQQSHGIRNI